MNNGTVRVSVPWLGLLFATLVILKLLGKITISWLWVFSPIWIPFGVFLTVVAVIGIIALIVGLLDR